MRNAEVLAKFGPLLLDGSHRHLFPFGLGQIPINLHALRPKNLRVLRRSAVEDIEVAVQLPLKQPRGQFRGIRTCLLAGPVMDVLQSVAQHSEVAIGIVHGLDGAQQGLQRRLA